MHVFNVQYTVLTFLVNSYFSLLVHNVKPTIANLSLHIALIFYSILVKCLGYARMDIAYTFSYLNFHILENAISEWPNKSQLVGLFRTFRRYIDRTDCKKTLNVSFRLLCHHFFRSK